MAVDANLAWIAGIFHGATAEPTVDVMNYTWLANAYRNVDLSVVWNTYLDGYVYVNFHLSILRLHGFVALDELSDSQILQCGPQCARSC